MDKAMQGVILPGQERVEIEQFDRPEPGHGQVLIKLKASGLCGSDLRAIYHEHTGSGAERYQNVIAGHEPAGQVEAVGPGVSGFEPGDRRLPHPGLRALRGVPQRVHDRVYLDGAGRIRLAARRGPRRLPAGRSPHPAPPA